MERNEAVVIQAAHYDETERRLMRDPHVIAMADEIREGIRSHGVSRQHLFNGNAARHEFMLKANEEYHRRAQGAWQGGHLGAVPNAIRRLLDGEDT